MSRLGKTPIPLPQGVEVKMNEEGSVHIQGPKGKLQLQLPEGLALKMEESGVLLDCDEKRIKRKAFWGLFRSLLKNDIQGVSTGYEVRLSLVGVGYRANVMGQKLDMQLGFSHPTQLDIPEGIEVKVEKGTSISIKGASKRLVGQFAADVRRLKPPEPYKGKGVRYENERVRKKEGKAAKGKA